MAICSDNPFIPRDRIEELKAYIRAEGLDLELAKEVLAGYLGKFEKHFLDREISWIRYIKVLEVHTH